MAPAPPPNASAPPPLPSAAPRGPHSLRSTLLRTLGGLVVALLVVAAGVWGVAQVGRYRACHEAVAEAEQALARAEAVPRAPRAGLDRLRAFRAVRNAARRAVETGWDDGTAAALLRTARDALVRRPLTVRNTLRIRNTSSGRAGRPAGDDTMAWTVDVRPGDLLEVWTHGRILRYPVTYGTPEEVRFRADGVFYYMNGRRVGVELEGPGARDWLNEAPDEELRDLVYLCTGRIDPDERAGFRRRMGRPLIIDVNDGHLADLWPMLPDLDPYALLVNTGLPEAEAKALAGLGNLRILHMQKHLGPDLGPLGALTELEELHIHATDAPDLAPLAKLTRLARLELAYANDIDDLAPLRQCRDLTYLGFLVRGAQVSFAPLADLPELRRVATMVRVTTPSWASHPRVREALDWVGVDPPSPRVDLAGAEQLSRLRELDIYPAAYPMRRGPGGGTPPHVSLLTGLRDLRHLSCAVPLAGDPAALDALDRLENLQITLDRDAKSVPAWPSLTKLKRLSLTGMKARLAPETLDGKPHLRQVDLYLAAASGAGGTPESVERLNIEADHLDALLRPMQPLPNLRRLVVRGEIGDTALRRIAALCPNLRHAMLDVSNATGLAPLGELRRLQRLTLTTRMSRRDLTPVGRLDDLRTLALSDMHCESLEPVGRLQRLESLDLNGCQIPTGLEPVGRLGNLRELTLTYCRGATDLSPLANLKRLDVLQLQHLRGLDDISPLAELPRLVSLTLFAEGVTDYSPLHDKETLTWVWLNSGLGRSFTQEEKDRFPACRITFD